MITEDIFSYNRCIVKGQSRYRMDISILIQELAAIMGPEFLAMNDPRRVIFGFDFLREVHFLGTGLHVGRRVD